MYDDEEEFFEADISSDCEEEMQTFLFPIGSVIKYKFESMKYTVMGYVTYNGDVFHIVLDEYMQEFDQYIDKYDRWDIVGVA